MDTRKKKVLAGIIVLIVIIIGGITFYKLSNYFWPADPKRIAEKKCKEYTKYACDHPFSSNSSQIFLGEIAPLGMFPHMAIISIADPTNPSGYKSCGGSLISEQFVLTAAHCSGKVPGLRITVGLGVSDLSVDFTQHLVKKAYLHPLVNFSTVPVEYDYLLLELSEKVTFTPYLRPICLETEYLGKYDRIIVTGWGLTEANKSSTTLKLADQVIDGEIRRTCTLGVKPIFSADIFAQLICAGWPNSSMSGQEGDSGAPLQVISDSQCANTYVQIGVFSAGESPTANWNKTVISLFYKVANAVPWIVSIVWPNESA